MGNRQLASKAEPAEQAQAVFVPARSVSKQMAERFARRKTWRHFVALLYVVSLTAYLVWRYTIINPDSLALSVAYFVTECIGFILGLTAIYATWSYNHRETKPAPQGLSVDVFVPTYKEPLHIIRRTVMAARDIRYPHGTFLLDDGKRDEVKALAKELGVTYLRRPGNEHAKAGNLNYGLARSKADFVMAFDADHIALPHALAALLGFFDDEEVALVQTPQDYYNIDAFQYVNSGRTGGLWHDQSAFYNLAQPCADASNASSCVGTGVVYRRSALDKIGGIPVTTVTEDIHTSLKLHKAGYKTVFLNESIAYGVAASDLGEYYKTRHRWGHGNLHALAHENILFCKGLTLKQRLHYIALGLIYLEGWQQLLLLSIPVIALVFGLQPFTITIFNVAIVLAFPFLSYLLLQETGCGFARYWANELFSMARWPVYLKSTLGLFGKKISFISSSKNIRGKIDWKLMMPQIAATAASLCAVGYGISRLNDTGFQTGPLAEFAYRMLTRFSADGIDIHAVMPRGYTVELVAIAGFWAIFNAVRGGIFTRKVLHDARKTHEFFRFKIPVPALAAQSGDLRGCVSQLSEDWAAIDLYGETAAKGDTLSLTALMPAGALPVEIAVEETAENGKHVAGRLVWKTDKERDALANGLYSVDWHREFLHRHAYFLTPSDLFLACLGVHAAARVEKGDWCAALYEDARGKKHYGIFIAQNEATGTPSFLAFDDLAAGIGLKMTLLRSRGAESVIIETLAPEPLASLVTCGIDGAIPRRYAAKLVAEIAQ